MVAGFCFDLHAPVLGSADDQVGLGRQAAAKEGQPVRAALPSLHQPASTGRRADLFTHPHPDSPFPLFPMAALRALCVGRGRQPKQGLLCQSAQDRLRLWDDGQHGLSA
jgi:hypothetical protein